MKQGETSLECGGGLGRSPDLSFRIASTSRSSEKRVQSSLHGLARLDCFLVALAARDIAARAFGALRLTFRVRAMVKGLDL